MISKIFHDLEQFNRLLLRFKAREAATRFVSMPTRRIRSSGGRCGGERLKRMIYRGCNVERTAATVRRSCAERAR
jgi:hypothetical protein